MDMVSVGDYDSGLLDLVHRVHMVVRGRCKDHSGRRRWSHHMDMLRGTYIGGGRDRGAFIAAYGRGATGLIGPTKA